MYYDAKIQKLSSAQLRKLLHGQKVRVKHGDHHEVQLNEEQLKKLGKAHKKNTATTIQLDPYQVDIHRKTLGHGLFSALQKGAQMLAPILQPVATQLLHQGVDKGMEALSNQIQGNGFKKKGRGRPKKGGMVLSNAVRSAIEGSALVPAGYGLKKGKKGKGIIGSILGNVLPF